ncbi:unnamed protein product [Meloidogyne enterolobii]|uniref:Uncharacterized protein n=1 Tax=Meloidogyne enterolobii TaxID=390850 RepID=A0ACB1ATU4_MELEN
MINFLIKFLILFCLIIKTHAWDWGDYPSPRASTYFKCGIQNRTYVCDPDAMLTDHQRKEIIKLVEDFKEKTKRPNSTIPCIREGLRLIVALAKISMDATHSGFTYLCLDGIKWTSSDKTKCESDVQGIELNMDAVRFCSQTYLTWNLPDAEFSKLREENPLLKNGNYFAALKGYIEKLQMLYIQRFSIFDNPDASNETNMKLLEFNAAIRESNKYGIISIIFSLILSTVLLFLIRQIRLLKNDLNQRNAPKIELQLMTPIQPVEAVENKKDKKKEVEETPKNLLNL